MTEELVTFETAKLAREKGFDEVCRDVWHNWNGEWLTSKDLFAPNPHNFLPFEVKKIYEELTHYKPTKNSTLPPNIIVRPTQDLLERWLREMHNYYMQVETGIGGYNYLAIEGKTGAVLYDSSMRFSGDVLYFDTYELAREAALLHALNLLP